MEEEMTGLRFEQALKDISNFESEMNNAWQDTKRSYNELFSLLSEKWASSKAKTTCENLAKEANIMLGEFLQSFHDAAGHFSAAVRNVAAAHGISCPDDKYGYGANLYNPNSIGTSDYLDPAVFKESIDGAVGMVKQLVIDGLNKFVTEMEKIEIEINEVPTTIALFDTEGAQQTSFKNAVERIKETTLGMTYRIVKYISTAINEEIEIIEKAKEEAKEALDSK